MITWSQPRRRGVITGETGTRVHYVVAPRLLPGPRVGRVKRWARNVGGSDLRTCATEEDAMAACERDWAKNGEGAVA